MNYTQKEKFIDKICGVALMLIFVEIMYQIVHSSYTEFNYNLNNVTTWVWVASGIFLVGAIVLLVYAYMKKSRSKIFYGWELFIFSITLALLPGCYLYFSRPFTEIRRIFPFAFLFYYIGKAVYVIKHRNDVVKTNNNSKKRGKH